MNHSGSEKSATKQLRLRLIRRAVLGAIILLVASGCASFHGRVSGKPWSQTAEQAEQEQEADMSPSWDWQFSP